MMSLNLPWTRAVHNITTNVINTTPSKMMDYLRIGGGQRVFCNPPYGKEIYKWVEKCYHESTKENTLVCLLIPSRTDTRYFHDFISQRCEIRFIKGRLKFGGRNTGAPFPSMLAIFRGPKFNERAK